MEFSRSSSLALPLGAVTFHSPPLTHSASATLVLAAAQTHQAPFWQLLLNVSSSQRVSLILYSLLNPYNSPFSQHSSWSGIGFSPVFIVCIPLRRHIIFYYLLFTAVFLYQEIHFLGTKSISIWWIFIKGINLPFHPHAKCTVIEKVSPTLQVLITSSAVT